MIEPWTLWRYWQGVASSNPRRLTIDDANLRGQWCIVTGGNNGIGREAAMTFCAWGANVVLACRPDPPSHESRPQRVVDECRERARQAGCGSSVIEWWPIDLSSLSSVVDFASRWTATGRPLHVLANNAGIGRPRGVRGKVTTEDGFELVHQVNFLSHALLAQLLLPSMAKAEQSRAVGTTSGMHFLGDFDIAGANSGKSAYAVNKLLYQVWIAEFQRRLAQHPELRHISAYGVNPGYVNTGIFQKADGDGDQSWMAWLLTTLVDYYAISPQQGSLAITHASVFDDADGAVRARGSYFNRIWPEKPMPHALDEMCRAQVWEFVQKELARFKLPDL